MLGGFFNAETLELFRHSPRPALRSHQLCAPLLTVRPGYSSPRQHFTGAFSPSWGEPAVTPSLSSTQQRFTSIKAASALYSLATFHFSSRFGKPRDSRSSLLHAYHDGKRAMNEPNPILHKQALCSAEHLPGSDAEEAEELCHQVPKPRCRSSPWCFTKGTENPPFPRSQVRQLPSKGQGWERFIFRPPQYSVLWEMHQALTFAERLPPPPLSQNSTA